LHAFDLGGVLQLDDAPSGCPIEPREVSLTDRLRTFVRAWAAVGAWTLGLVILVHIYIELYAQAHPSMQSMRFVLERSVLNAGALLAPAAIAAGLRSRGLRRLDLLALALSIAAVSFLITGILNPVIEYYPFGPGLPGDVLERRAYVLENPPEEYSYSVDHPLRIAPNWLLFVFLAPFAVALFAVMMVWVGASLARSTTGLSPPARRNVHLAVAVLVGGSPFFLYGSIGAWVRGDVSRPGWVVLLILVTPALALLVLHALRRRDTTPLHDSGRSGVS
jgi:hypothetical protein